MSEVRRTQMRFFVNPLLKKFQEANIILEDQNSQIEKQIYERLSDLSQPSLQSFTIYLQSQCGITIRTIVQMVRELTKNKDVQKILKQNLTKCWIKCEIYSFKMPKRDKRLKIAEVIDKFPFKGSSLNRLVTACFDVIDQKITPEQMIKIKQILLKDHPDKINSLFSEQITLPKISEDPNKSIPERLNDMLNDYDYFPPCSLDKNSNYPDSLQKQVQKELIISFVQLHQLSSKLQGHKLKGLHNQIGQLQNKIIKKGQRNAKTQQLIKRLKLASTSQQKYILLSALKTRLFGINILQLQRLISNTEQSKHKIKDRDVILLLGSTGAGKTTTILKLLGYKLKKVIYRELQTLIPQNLKNQHKRFIASPQCTSITRYLNVTEVPQEMYHKYMLKNKRNYCLADSPGFFDTAGIEVEIANKIGVLNGLSECHSLTILIIIPYETVTAARGQGLINISEAISNLFNNFQECKQSILFMFNKVPQESIDEVPLKIKNKIDNLSHGQNSTLITNILSHMMQCSEEKGNFIFPIASKSQQQTNFKGILERIFKMNKIIDPNSALKNGFSKSMMNEVNTYILNKKQRVEQCIEQGKINEAKFYYDLIIKLNSIFEGNNDGINQIIQKIQIYLTQKNELWLQHIRKGIQLLQQNKLNTKLIAQLKQTRKNLLQFSHYFNKCEHSNQLQLLVTTQKQQFYQYFIIQKSENNLLFDSIKTFSNIFMPQLLNHFAEIIQKQLLQSFNSIHISIQTKKIQQLAQAIPILLKSIKILNNFKTSVQIQQKLSSMIKQIQQLFNNYLKQIQQLINDKHLSITDRQITSISTNFKNLKQLQALKLIKKIDTKKQLNSFLKAYQSRFRQNLTNCQNHITNLLYIQPQQLKTPPLNQIKQIKSMIKQVFINVTFEPLSKDFNDEIRHTKQQILSQLDKNLNRLCQFVYSIKHNKIKDVKDKFILTKNNYFILVKICEIIKEKKPIQQINSIITEKIMEIIDFLGKMIDLLEVKLSPLLKNNIQKAKQYFQVIQNLQTVNDISLQLNNKIQQLRTNFIKRLQLPFSDFQQFINNSLTISNEYSFSSLIFQKMQRFCDYSIEISKILTHKDRPQSNPHEYNIEQKLSSFIIYLKSKIDSFLESTFHDQSTIKSMRQYIRSIISLNEKQPTKIYLSNTIGIQIPSLLQEVRYKIDEIINEITQNFEDITSKEFDIGEVLQIAQKCKKYIIIEEAIQTKKNNMYLKNLLEKKINKYMSDNINTDKQTAIFHIKGNKPSNINFYQVNIINERLTLLNTAEAKEKKTKIYNEIRNIQKGILILLKNMRNQMGKQIQDDYYINRFLFLEYFQSFNEAFILQKELNKLYKQTKQFQISNSLHETAKVTIYYFQNIYEHILKYFEQLRFNNISTTINTIAIVQSQLNQQQYFNPQQDDSSIEPKRLQTVKNLRQFSNNSISNIQSKIDNFGQTSMMLSSISFNHINLRRYLQIWQQKLQQSLQKTYCQQSQEFKPDEKFKTYYLNNYSDPKFINMLQLQQKKQQIDRNIQNYFSSLQKQYIQAQSQHKKAIQNQWQDSLRYLSLTIRQPYKQKLKELKQSVKMQINISNLLVSKAFSIEKQDQSFQEIAQRFTQEYYKSNQDSFLEEVQRNEFFGNKCLMLKKGIDLEAFKDQMSPFFGEIKQSEFFLRRFKKQLKNNQNIIDEFLKNYQVLQRNMKDNQNIPTLKKKLSFW